MIKKESKNNVLDEEADEDEEDAEVGGARCTKCTTQLSTSAK